jgi:formylglycine-generating enzyme required for sulfatase activity
LVVVPAGSFVMGSDARERVIARSLSSPATVEADWFSAELARRRVDTQAFCINRTPVTQAQYAEFVRSTSHRPPDISRDEYQGQGFLVHDL